MKDNRSRRTKEKLLSTDYCVWLYANDGRYIDAYSFKTFHDAVEFIETFTSITNCKVKLKFTNIYDIVPKEGENK